MNACSGLLLLLVGLAYPLPQGQREISGEDAVIVEALGSEVEEDREGRALSDIPRDTSGLHQAGFRLPLDDAVVVIEAGAEDREGKALSDIPEDRSGPSEAGFRHPLDDDTLIVVQSGIPKDNSKPGQAGFRLLPAITEEEEDKREDKALPDIPRDRSGSSEAGFRLPLDDDVVVIEAEEEDADREGKALSDIPRDRSGTNVAGFRLPLDDEILSDSLVNSAANQHSERSVDSGADDDFVILEADPDNTEDAPLQDIPRDRSGLLEAGFKLPLPDVQVNRQSKINIDDVVVVEATSGSDNADSEEVVIDSPDALIVVQSGIPKDNSEPGQAGFRLLPAITGDGEDNREGKALSDIPRDRSGPSEAGFRLPLDDDVVVIEAEEEDTEREGKALSDIPRDRSGTNEAGFRLPLDDEILTDSSLVNSAANQHSERSVDSGADDDFVILEADPDNTEDASLQDIPRDRSGLLEAGFKLPLPEVQVTRQSKINIDDVVVVEATSGSDNADSEKVVIDSPDALVVVQSGIPKDNSEPGQAGFRLLPAITGDEEDNREGKALSDIPRDKSGPSEAGFRLPLDDDVVVIEAEEEDAEREGKALSDTPRDRSGPNAAGFRLPLGDQVFSDSSLVNSAANQQSERSAGDSNSEVDADFVILEADPDITGDTPLQDIPRDRSGLVEAGFRLPLPEDQVNKQSKEIVAGKSKANILVVAAEELETEGDEDQTEEEDRDIDIVVVEATVARTNENQENAIPTDHTDTGDVAEKPLIVVQSDIPRDNSAPEKAGFRLLPSALQTEEEEEEDESIFSTDELEEHEPEDDIDDESSVNDNSSQAQETNSDYVTKDSSECRKPVKRSRCREVKVFWYYNTYSKKCQSYMFGGCGRGTDGNWFPSEEECQAVCTSE